MGTEDIKKTLTIQKKRKHKIPAQEFVSTGSTLLNLACTGRPNAGFAKGKYYFLVGDSSSGKTFLSLTCLAEAAVNPNFDEYNLYHDDVENGSLMDFVKFFGPKMAERVKPPPSGESSVTVEDFYFNLDAALKGSKPCIYILDSMDGLTADDDEKKFEEHRKARARIAKKDGKEAKDPSGSFGTAKAKANSTGLRRIIPKLAKTGSILIIISQTRDNIGYMVMDKKTRAGGRALKFYATLEIWSSVKEKIKKSVNGKNRVIGVVSQVQVKKNRVNGRDRTVTVPIYPSFGIDDIGSCVDYLLSEGHWKKGSGGINAQEFEFKGPREKLIARVEMEDREKELRQIVAAVWRDIEDACSVKRKPRYE